MQHALFQVAFAHLHDVRIVRRIVGALTILDYESVVVGLQTKLNG